MKYSKEQLKEFINQAHVLDLFEIVFDESKDSICSTGHTDNLNDLKFDENGVTECRITELNFEEFSQRYPNTNWSEIYPEPEEDGKGNYILDKVVLVIEVPKELYLSKVYE